MTTDEALSALLVAAEQRRLTPAELARLRKILSRKARGRPRRTPLHEFQDEFGRAALYAFARAKGATYDAAVADAASKAATSVRRIKASFRWIESRLGLNRTDFEHFFRRDDQISKRISKAGLAGFEIKELASLAFINAFNKTINAAYSDEDRAEMLFAGTLQRLYLEAHSQTSTALDHITQQGTKQGVAPPVTTHEEVALLVEAIASNVTTMLIKRGCTKSP